MHQSHSNSCLMVSWITFLSVGLYFFHEILPATLDWKWKGMTLQSKLFDFAKEISYTVVTHTAVVQRRTAHYSTCIERNNSNRFDGLSWQDYGLHIASAVCEWAVAICFVLHFSTCSFEFKVSSVGSSEDLSIHHCQCHCVKNTTVCVFLCFPSTGVYHHSDSQLGKLLWTTWVIVMIE